MEQRISYLVLDNRCLPFLRADGSGWDVISREPLQVAPGESVVVPVGIGVTVPYGWECQARPDSDLAGLGCLASCGTVVREGELCLVLLNVSLEAVSLPPYTRVGRIVFSELPWVELVAVGA